MKPKFSLFCAIFRLMCFCNYPWTFSAVVCSVPRDEFRVNFFLLVRSKLTKGEISTQRNSTEQFSASMDTFVLLKILGVIGLCFTSLTLPKPSTFCLFSTSVWRFPFKTLFSSSIEHRSHESLGFLHRRFTQPSLCLRSNLFNYRFFQDFSSFCCYIFKDIENKCGICVFLMLLKKIENVCAVENDGTFFIYLIAKLQTFMEVHNSNLEL